MKKRDREASPVSKAEFVGLLVVLGLRDRRKYRELRDVGWREAIPADSDCPN